MKRYYNTRVLVISDTHFPYESEHTWSFLKQVKQEFKPDRIVHCGDIVDFYNASRFPKDVDHPDSFPNELLKIRKCINKLAKIFPEMEVVIGNHDMRLNSKVSSVNLPESVIRSFPEIIGAPKGWKFHEDDYTLTVDSTREQITFCHHRGANVFLAAQRLGRTLVAGHQHSKGKVEGFNNGIRTYYGCNTPNLISNEGAPFSYTKLSNINPVRGCLLITDGVPAMKVLP